MVIILMVSPTHAAIKMPRIFSDNMVLQRETPLKIWGWADPRERVSVSIEGQNKSTRADRNGQWSVILDPLNAGGPYELTVRGQNTLTFNNILIGDVWLGSGQSNMQWSVRQSDNPEEEILPDMFARVEIVKREVNDTLTVPLYAIMTINDEQVVYVVSDGIARTRRVSTGIQEGWMMQVTKGLHPGERVIVVGHRRVSDEQKVNVVRTVSNLADL